MKLNQKEELLIEYDLLQKVFPKVTYNKMLEKYIIKLEDYIPLNLSINHLRKLEEMCKSYDIELEKLPPQITAEESFQLFKEYQRLRNHSIQDDKTTKRQIEIKQKIAIGYMALVYKTITKKLSSINERLPQEDIFQIGYEVLLKTIDSYDPSRNKTFNDYLREHLVFEVIAKTISESRGLPYAVGYDINRINYAKTRLEIDRDEENFNKKISEETRITPTRVKNLLTADELSKNTGSIEDIIEDITSEIDLEDSYIKKRLRENILKIIDLLPQQQKEIILLHYGFVDGRKHPFDEIAKIYGYTRGERARQIKDEALKTLRLPIFLPYINPNQDQSDINLNSYLYSKKPTVIQKRIDYIEEQLICSLSEEEIRSLLSNLPNFDIEVLLLSLGKKDGIKYSYKEIGEMLKQPESVIETTKKTTLKNLRNSISEKINKNSDRSFLQKLLQNYLLSNSKKKKKH